MLIESIRKLTNLRWLNLFEVDYEHDNGSRGQWVFCSRKETPMPGTAPLQAEAVFVVPLLKTAEGPRLVVTREFRVPLGDWEYSFPAGLCEPGEEIATTIRRELAEETGLELQRILSVSPPVVSSAGLSDESAVIACVECTGEPHSRHNDGLEQIEVLVLDLDGVRKLRQSPYKFSAKAWLVLTLFEALGSLSWPESL